MNSYLCMYHVICLHPHVWQINTKVAVSELSSLVIPSPLSVGRTFESSPIGCN